MKIKYLLFLLLISVVEAYAKTPRPVAFFHDGAYDDVFALLVLAHEPSIDIKFIVIETTGETSCEKGLYSTLGILNKLERLDIPVFCGPKISLTKIEHDIDIEFPKKWRDEINDLNAIIWGYNLPEHDGHLGFRDDAEAKNTNNNIERSILKNKDLKRKYKQALELFRQDKSLEKIEDIILKQEKGIDILETGPVVTLANLFKNRSDILNKVNSIFIMAGAFNIKGEKPPGLWGKIGNIQTVFTPSYIINEDAEWNVFIAPYDFYFLLQKVKGSKTKLFVVPLNATKYTPITLEYEKRFFAILNNSADAKTKATIDVFNKVLVRYRFQISKGFLDFWDTLAAVLFIDYLNQNVTDAYFVDKRVKVAADVQDHPTDFYDNYEKSRLSEKYKINYERFVDNLREHHVWAKNELNMPNAIDIYGRTSFAEDNNLAYPLASVYLRVNKNYFDRRLFEILPKY